MDFSKPFSANHLECVNQTINTQINEIINMNNKLKFFLYAKFQTNNFWEEW